MKRTFIHKDDKSDKFWAIEVEGNSFTVTYGKTGTAGQMQKKTFADAETSQKEADKLIAEKIKKGYAEGGDNVSVAEKPKAAAGATVPELDEKNFLNVVQKIAIAEAEEKYHISEYIYDVDEWDDEDEEHTWCVHHGDLHVASVDAGSLADSSYYSLIVDGNLTVDGDVDWWEELGQSLLMITGDLKCRNLFMGGCPQIVVRGNLTVENGILGRNGDDGGVLTVKGGTKAQTIVNTSYFNMNFGSRPEAVIIGDEDNEGEVDYSADDALEVLLPQFLEEDSIDDDKIKKAFIAGKPILRKNAQTAVQKLAAQFDTMLEHADDVKTLSLCDCGLKKIPPQVFQFPHLIELDLSENDIAEIPADIAKLKHLEKLDMYRNSLTSLPDEMAKLHCLTYLSLSQNEFEEIPEVVGQLDSLETLYIDEFTALPKSIVNLTNLKELYLSDCKAKKSLSLDAICKLTSLTDLTLKDLGVTAFPDELLNLVELESLTIDFGKKLTHFPDLSGLPKLRKLVLDGYDPSDADVSKLPIWNIPTLEELVFNRFCDDEDRKERKGCVFLPDAFDGLPNLQRFLLWSSKLFSELPESFFRLKNLKEVTFKRAKLNSQTLAKIRAAFPEGVIFHLEDSSEASDVNDPNWQEVHKLVKKGAELASDYEYAKAVKSYEKALALCKTATKYSEYDKLYATYGCVYSLGYMVPSAAGDAKVKLTDDAIKYSEQAFAMVKPYSQLWIFTQEGAFHKEVNRIVGNTLGWYLMERGQLDRALEAIERAAECVDDYSQYFVYDTKVRILLKMGRANDAFLIVDRVLAQHPDFGDFQDIKKDKAFKKWQKENGSAETDF